MSFQPEKPAFCLNLIGNFAGDDRGSVWFLSSSLLLEQHRIKLQVTSIWQWLHRKMPMFWDGDPLFVADIVLFLQLLPPYAVPHLLYCCSSYQSLSQLVRVQHCGKRWVRIQAGIHMLFPATRMQRGYSSSVLPNNIISKAPYKNMSNWASDKGLSVYLFEQWKIPKSHNLFQLFSVFVPEPFCGHRI